MALNPFSFSPKLVQWVVTGLLGLALAVLIALAGQAPPAQASLYWASVNGATLTSGVQSATPVFCFVGDAVTSRPQRVVQVVQYLHEFENVGNITFMAPSGNSLDYEIGPSGSLNNLKCPNPTSQTLPNGAAGSYYSGDIRLVLPGTNVEATTPVPGLGCMTDKLKSAPVCVARDGSHIDCFARGVDDRTWDKHWDAAAATPWGGWSQTLDGTTNTKPAVVSSSATNLEVIAKGISNKALYSRTWNNGTWDAAWSEIPGTLGNATSAPACVAHNSGYLTCAVRWSDGYIYVATRAGTIWGGWVKTPLITGLESGSSLGFAPAITSWNGGRLDVFARDLETLGVATLIHTWSTTNGVSWSMNGSGDPEDLGGNIAGAPACTGFSTGGGDGKIYCFARGTDGNLWKKYYPGGSVWNPWAGLGFEATSDPTVAFRTPLSLDLFADGPDGALWHTVSSNTVNWGSWDNLGENNGWGSWSNPPWTRDDPYSRACLYNLKIGDNPWCPVNGEFWPCASNPEVVPYLNHTLHEVGHALGLAHEFVRADANTVVPGCGLDGWATDGWISATYDRYSVMNYVNTACGITGNYDYTGLSALDKLAIHILYPPAGYPAEISGNPGIKSGQALTLTSAWKAWGANMSFVAHNYVWKVDGNAVSTTPDVFLSGLAAGDHSLSFAYDDFLGRHHSSSLKVMVLSPAAVTQAAVIGGALTSLYTPDFATLIPAVMH